MYVTAIFLIVSVLIFIGFLSNYFFDRTKIPDSLILIVLGILLGPVTNALFPGSVIAQIFRPDVFEGFAGLMASLAIMVIMFETGLNLDIRRVVTEAPRSFFYATAHYFTTAILSGVFAALLFGWDWPFAFMIGFLLGGTSAAIVIPLGKRIGLNSEEQTILELESTITNVYNVILVVAVAQYVLTASTDWRYPIQSILAAFSISIVFGALVGYFWQKVLRRLQTAPFSYMLTFAVLMAFYAIMNEFGGNGPLFALVFGLTLANVHLISPLRMVNMIQLHREISFFIRVFFFVFLGVIFKFSTDPLHWLFVGILSIISLTARYFAARLMNMQSSIEMATLIPRGLGEAVLSALLLQMFAGTEYMPVIADMVQIVSIAIIMTNVFTAAMVWYLLRLKGSAQTEPETSSAQTTSM
ncbi:MAG: potassium/hydrogen antiporter [Candidatus Diapherotrites archaeon]|nr:potassium/hydrogen antiporter [Candidatus Diapherotrites archaeon]MDN5366908.1 potassium/hydrogen antiporter [Candidatus Diapherotrites archaeon]